MTGHGTTFLDSLDERVSEILDACTQCGRCVEVCPMVDPAGLDRADAKSIVGGVLDILRTGEGPADAERWATVRSEEQTSELQSLMRISYAVFCLKKNTYNTQHRHT